jgi:glutaminyl-tRNA synthetase
MGKAFVCEQGQEEMRDYRDKGIPSPFRDRPVDLNLKLFNNMKLGLYEEGKMCLRAKIDYKNPNTTLRDPVIYRIRYTPHPHSDDKWCIYPLYDFTHPICDSLEGITHSLCTLEFEIRRELYYWYLEQLDLYRPFVWEYSRLNISNNIMSKRKL